MRSDKWMVDRQIDNTIVLHMNAICFDGSNN